MQYISIVLIAFIVPAALNLISARAAKSTTSSITHFIMRPSGDLATIGWVGAVFFMFCIIGSIYAGQFTSFLKCVFLTLFIISLLLIMAPVKGFWDVTVDGSKVTSSRVWLIRKTIDIGDIDYCYQNKGGYHIHLKGKRRKAMSIDGMSTNLRNWEKRMKKEDIEIRRAADVVLPPAEVIANDKDE